MASYRQVFQPPSKSGTGHTLTVRWTDDPPTKREERWMDVYVLVHTQPGSAASARSAIADLDGVEQVDQVWGKYDLVVRARGDEDGIPHRTLRQIQRVSGVQRTLTCPVLHSGRSVAAPAAA
jgi:hypothetical protein